MKQYILILLSLIGFSAIEASFINKSMMSKIALVTTSAIAGVLTTALPFQLHKESSMNNMDLINAQSPLYIAGASICACLSILIYEHEHKTLKKKY